MHDDRWARLIKDPTLWYFRVLLLVGLTVLLGVLIGSLAQTGGIKALFIGIVTVPLLCAVEFLVMKKAWWLPFFPGIFVGSQGIKVKTTTSVYVIPWDDIESTEVKPWGPMGTIWATGKVLWIVRRDGTSVPTPLAMDKRLSLTPKRTKEAAAEAVRSAIRSHQPQRPDDC